MTKASSRYLAPQFEVQVEDDIVFGQSRNEDCQMETLKLDVYSPVDDPRPLRPAILWFHGGGFRPGNNRRQIYIPMFANAFAARGYVGIAPDYRVRADPRSDLTSTIRDAVVDGQMALEWTRANLDEYRIDPRSIALAGGSAGGMLVLNLVHDPDQPVNGKRDGLIAVMSMGGQQADPGVWNRR